MRGDWEGGSLSLQQWFSVLVLGSAHLVCLSYLTHLTQDQDWKPLLYNVYLYISNTNGMGSFLLISGFLMTLSSVLVWQEKKKNVFGCYVYMSNNKYEVAMVYKFNSTCPLDNGLVLLLLVSYYLIHHCQAWNCYPFIILKTQTTHIL